MPRHHTIWNAELKQQVDIEFTVEEETARDAEEAKAVIDRDAEQIIQDRKELLDTKLADDSITFNELKELMRLRG